MTTVVKLQERIAELEEALRQSEKRYRAITETALAGIGITDPEENLTFVNSAFADMLGYAPGELVGMNLSLLTDPEEFDSYRERTREREGRGVRDHYATTLRRSDGSTVNVLVSASPLKAEDGSFHGTVGVVVDDTERKRAEEALASYARQQEALFQISAELARAVDEREVCQIVVRGLHKNLSYDYMGVFLVDEATGERVVQAAIGWPDAPSDWRIAPGRGLSERPLLDGQLHYTPDVTSDPRYVAGAGGGAEVDVPIQIGGEAIGVLVVESQQPYAFDQGDFVVLTAVVNQAAVALHRAREHQALKRAYADVEKTVEERTAELQEEIAERQRAEAERERLQQEIIEAQRQALHELSTPIIPLMDRIIVMPLIGSIDSMRARDITRSLLAGIREHRAKVVILDITGVPIVDSGVADHLNRTIQAARLKGARTIVTGISDAVAEIIVDLGIDWTNIETLSDLQTGLVVALDSLGIEVRRSNKTK